MIKRIKMIKDVGFINNYSESAHLPDFKKYNLIYGWNGTGKTTLSQLFALLDRENVESFPMGTYKIETSEGIFDHTTKYPKKIRVFNRYYVEENIDVISGKVKPIYIVGKENKDIYELIKADEKLLNGDPEAKAKGKLAELEESIKQKEKTEKDLGKVFTDVAKNIGTALTGSSIRSYRKNDAERSFSKLTAKRLLPESELHNSLLIIKQLVKPILYTMDGQAVKEKESIELSATQLVRETVDSLVIERLKEDSDISKWVEEGLDLHMKKESRNCEYCSQPLPQQRIKELLAHFNDADRILKEKIDTLASKVNHIISEIKINEPLDRANLYDELQEEYSKHVDDYSTYKNELLGVLESLIDELHNKKLHTTTSIEYIIEIDCIRFINVIKHINDIIITHNNKTNNFTAVKEQSEKSIELHYLSEIYDTVKELELEIEGIKNNIDHLKDGDPNIKDDVGIDKLQERIIENKAKIATSEEACRRLNEGLKTFLGREELRFVPAEVGYYIKRGKNTASCLSEGEKTAIAFIYFITHLRDDEFDISDGIVVIDDPVCSMDSNSLFRAFAFQKHAVQTAMQVFIFTHNFEYLHLLIGLYNDRANYYMIKNKQDTSNRMFCLDKLDSTIKDYPTEYNYLFKLLNEYQTDDTIASVYHIPNIARKVLEYFLLFMVPTKDNMYKKLTQIQYDEIKKSSLYKFTNDLSHLNGRNYSPTLIKECHDNVKYLLEMIEEVFPDHYNHLYNTL